MMNTARKLRGSIFALVAGAFAAEADSPPTATAGAYDEKVIAVIETRPCDYDIGLATIDTIMDPGFRIIFR